MAKTFEYAAALEADGRLLADGGDPLEPGEAWTPEHLVLAGLMRCTLKSLRFHADRRGVSASGGATAEGVVTRREEDGRFAFVDPSIAGSTSGSSRCRRPRRCTSCSTSPSGTASSAPL